MRLAATQKLNEQKNVRKVLKIACNIGSHHNHNATALNVEMVLRRVRGLCGKLTGARPSKLPWARRHQKARTITQPTQRLNAPKSLSLSSS